MFTETELREALEHSAARADAPALGTTDVTHEDPKRQWLLPLVAAASVAALAAGVIALAGSAGNDTGPATRDDRAATSIASPTAALPSESGPLATVDLVDRAVVGVDAEYVFGQAGDRQTGAQTIRHSLGTGRHDGVMTVDIAPKAAIDASRVERGKKVTIAGTTGWYSALKLYPLDGSTGPGSDKWLPHWTIAFRAPSGDWAFAWIELGIEGEDSNLTADDVSVDSTSKIVDAYGGLKLRWTDGAARQPLRFATLPAGTTLESASLDQLDGKIDSELLTFSRGKDTLDVQLTGNDAPLGPVCVIPSRGTMSSTSCEHPPSRTVTSGTLTVSGNGYDESEQRAVLKGIRVIADPADYVSFEDALTP